MPMYVSCIVIWYHHFFLSFKRSIDLVWKKNETPFQILQHQEKRERWQRHKNWHDFIAFFQPIYLHNISLVTIHGKDFFMTLVQYGGQIIGCSKAEYSSASFTIRKALVNSSHSSDEKLLTIIYLLYVVVSLERF